MTGLPEFASFFVYILLYVGFFGFLLYRKIKQYLIGMSTTKDFNKGN